MVPTAHTENNPTTMRPAELPEVDPGFEQRLVDAIRPISESFLAMGLHHLFSTGLFDRLDDTKPTAVADLARDLDMDGRRLRAFLRFLANEAVVAISDDQVVLTPRGAAFGEFRSWYTFLVGGYTGTVGQIGSGLRIGARPCTRNGADVGVGSCEIARYDGIPITASLLERAGVAPRTVLDLGCGNGLYLVEMCARLPEVSAWGAEPDANAFAEAEGLVEQNGMQDRIRLVNTSAQGFLANPPADCHPDVLVLGYVLQEILGQEGEAAVTAFLNAVTTAFPDIAIAVVEVADRSADPAVMRHELARAFWNPYFLIHPFTNQQLESPEYWERLFAASELTVRATATTPLAVDSTGIEIGYLLSRSDR